MSVRARECFSVTKSPLFLVIVLACLLLHAEPVCGCRYNVREVGFIDVGIEPYHLYVYLPQDTAAEDVATLKDEVEAALADSNIRFEPVMGGADMNHPAAKFLASHGIGDLPAAALVSPDGQSLPLSLVRTAGSLGQAVTSALDGMLHSPTCQSILEKAAAGYGVVLLIEGPRPQRNAEAREAASSAIDRIGGQLDSLPKPISRPPELVTLDRPSLSREAVLLWSLGLKPQDINEPHAAVFYSRGRWIGPMFEGDMLTADNLTQVLSVIGGDCECGLDHRWLQGTMLPARWDEDLQARAAGSLGFDPEDPMIKMEMVSIVRRGMGGFAGPETSLGYREIQIGDEGVLDSPVVASDVVESQAENFARANPPQPEVRSLPLSRMLAVSLSGMAVLVAAASIVIVLKARRA